jgi:hypothetical protein
MGWATATVLGACGAAIVAALSLWASVNAWAQGRGDARKSVPVRVPVLRDYVDVPAFTLVTLTRLVLGAGAGLVLHSEVTGFTAMIAVGASAPVLLPRFLRELAEASVPASRDVPAAGRAPSAEPPSAAGAGERDR